MQPSANLDIFIVRCHSMGVSVLLLQKREDEDAAVTLSKLPLTVSSDEGWISCCHCVQVLPHFLIQHLHHVGEKPNRWLKQSKQREEWSPTATYGHPKHNVTWYAEQPWTVNSVYWNLSIYLQTIWKGYSGKNVTRGLLHHDTELNTPTKLL